ncbi:MAG: hypothetical protein F6K25_11830 [Okeania sp. SIO2G4]|uniref:hypothetical protein n=1 Tax=unclassified Okeania TaxID=2634635 RepID=UPI0013B7323C|nr:MULTISPECIES: hypothetical protein [unclassified Okeania]NEP05066.1 hypothetical protein [Okeania sp. SIO4D6]NEP39923.1 hypothetical protein [Okeania sp. SIO2H7]NEP72716.1 hypothetical protein [Okeania sp. SIO2G5]NEP93350.1 hypothetical protein [Okeania sp. SIO2F5]NEQ91362.1 hypothetical protein [Okeania sp. SIO2G4]
MSDRSNAEGRSIASLFLLTFSECFTGCLIYNQSDTHNLETFQLSVKKAIASAKAT